MTLLNYILLASGLHATTYGWGTNNCGDIGKPRPCSKGAITASGEIFDPDLPTAAVFAPTNLRLTPRTIYLRIAGGRCTKIRLNDKGNPRFIGERGFDLTPAAIRALTGQEPTRYWSGKVYVCNQARKYHEVSRSLSHHPLINVGIWYHTKSGPKKSRHHQP